MGVHWGGDYPKGEGWCDHAHLEMGVILWVSQRPSVACPGQVASQDGLRGMMALVPGWN